MVRVVLLAAAVSLLSFDSPSLAQEERLSPLTVSRVYTTRGGIHTTTRGTIRLVFARDDGWLVFHGGPNMYHFSPDGVHWTGREISQFASRSNLVRESAVYGLARIDVDPDPESRDMVVASLQGSIHGEVIEWKEPIPVPHLTLAYYVDLRQDSSGRFTATGRVLHRDDAGNVSGITVEWARSLRPHDISEWEPQRRAIHHVSDMKSSEIHENIPLDDGKSYVIAMLSVDGEGRLYGNLFDGEKRDDDVLLAENMSTVRGSDKRMAAVWDPGTRTIHLSYVDHDSVLWYRTCSSPYRAEDWSDPVRLQPFKVFTNVMSLDTSRDPAQVCLLYGKTMFEHADPRWQSGELYVTKYGGGAWSEPVLVSEPSTTDNWYPNMNADVSRGIGVLYLRGVPEDQAAVKNTDFDIMFSSTGPPR